MPLRSDHMFTYSVMIPVAGGMLFAKLAAGKRGANTD